VGVDRTLPGEEFFYRQLVSSADFLKAYHASAHRVDDYGLAPDYPAFCIGGRAGRSRDPPRWRNATKTSIHLTCTRNVRERLQKRKILEN
jgi:hypothetical protein